jgi:hypothetical protein
VDEDERQRYHQECEPEQEIVEQGVVCNAKSSARRQHHIQVQYLPDVRGSVRPAQIINSENDIT